MIHLGEIVDWLVRGGGTQATWSSAAWPSTLVVLCPAGCLPCFEHVPQLFIVLFATCKKGKITLIETRLKVLSTSHSLKINVLFAKKV